MGLDLVELIIAIEQHFEIEIPNADAARLRTPRAVIDYLTPRLANTRKTSGDTSVCPTQQAFYRVRVALNVSLGIPRSAIVPKRPLRDLIPQDNRAHIWRSLHEYLPSHGTSSSWPPLARPAWLERTLISIATTIFLLVLVAGAAKFSPGLGVLLASGVTTALIVAANRLTASWRAEFRPAHFTVGDLARSLALPTTLDRPTPTPWTREHIAQDVRALVMRELGLESVTDDARFVEDLGAD